MVTKKESDGNHPSSHYLAVEDPSKPTTWHLRFKDASGKVDRALCGAAWAALHDGYRGNKYAGAKAGVALVKLKGVYKSQGWPLPGSSDPGSKGGKMSSDSYSNDEVQRALTAALGTDGPYGYWIRDVYDTWFVYQNYGDNVLYKQDYKFDDATGTATLEGNPETVNEHVLYEVAKAGTFSMDGAPEEGPDDLVYRTGKLFEVGDYPDQRLSVDADELVDATTNFRPVPVDLEHVDTLLSGKLGNLVHVDPTEDGSEMTGTVAIPRWLDSALGPDPIKVSTHWRTDTKRLIGLAFAKRPQITDAALLGAFAGARHSKTDLAALQSVHDLAVKLGATCAAAPTKTAGKMSKEATRMGEESSIFKKLAAALTRVADEPEPGEGGVVSDPPPTKESGPVPKDDPAQARFSALEKEVVSLRAKNARDAFFSRVESAVKDGLLMPAEAKKWTDRFPAEAKFSSVDGPTQASTLEGLFADVVESREKHPLFSERAGAFALPDEPGKAPNGYLDGKKDAQSFVNSNFNSK